MRTTVFSRTDVRVQFSVTGYDGELITPTIYTVTATVRDKPSAIVEVQDPSINAAGNVEAIVYCPGPGVVDVELLVTAPVRVRWQTSYTSQP